MASSSHQEPQVDGFTPPPVAESKKDHQHDLAKPDLDVKQHPFPLATIKKIMKADKDVKMVSADAPVVMAKACEFFVQKLTMKAWSYAEKRMRRTLRKYEIVDAVNESDDYEFLFDLRHDCPSWIKKDDVPLHASSPPGSVDSFGRMIEWPVTADHEEENVVEDDGEGDDVDREEKDDDNVQGNNL